MLFDERLLFIKPRGVKTRWASPENPLAEKGEAAKALGGRKGRACFPLRAGESGVLAQESGRSGTIRRIWLTINDRGADMLRGIRLNFYWDGCARPAVSSPLGDFFGTGLGRTAVFESACFTSPEGRSFNCYIPMPFKTGMKIIVTNESGRDLPLLFYDIDYTIGDEHGDDAMYFHAFFRRENPTTIKKDYEILPKIYGSGRYLGSNAGVIPDQGLYFKSWWGEGEVKIYLDGDEKYPTLSGTGTEDYIGSGWGQKRYSHFYQGCHIADEEKFEYCFYRYHIPDPVYFDEDIRVTIQQIGLWTLPDRPVFYYNNSEIYCVNGERFDFSKAAEGNSSGVFERRDDWSSCAYFYLDAPENNLPPLCAAAERMAGLV